MDEVSLSLSPLSLLERRHPKMGGTEGASGSVPWMELVVAMRGGIGAQGRRRAPE